MYSTIKFRLVENRYFVVLSKIGIFLILFVGSLTLNSVFSLTGAVGEETQIFYLFGGIILGLSLIFGKKYALVTFPGFVIFDLISGELGELEFSSLLIYALFSLIYLTEVILLRRLNFNVNLKFPKDIIFLVVVTIMLPIGILIFFTTLNLLASISIYPDFDLFSAILQLWLADLIGTLTIFPFVISLNYYIQKSTKDDTERTVTQKWSSRLKSKLSTNKIAIFLIALIPAINQLTVWIQQLTEVELFYLAYLPPIWLASTRDVKLTSISLTVTNISFFFQRNSASVRTIEFQMLLLIFTLVCLLYSIVIGERNSALEESNTKLQDTNQQLEEINKNLQISNRELEQFAYVASHDLQEPLRAITGYLQLFDRKYGDYPDAKAEKYVNGVISAAERMEKMINDLLAFSRVGTRNKEFSSVKLNDVITQVRENLSNIIEQTNASFVVDDLPVVHGNEIQMIQLFQNLISNSLKYCNGSPQITITSQNDRKMNIISVQDNGIGISPDYFDKIFIIFQRLHSKHEYDGSGIGLAISKKIVERHNGNIWVEAEEGKGSTFHISLPKIMEEK